MKDIAIKNFNPKPNTTAGLKALCSTTQVKISRLFSIIGTIPLFLFALANK